MMRRIFIVGFPRSGTTLVQTLLASHPRLLSLPETFFFYQVFSPRLRDRVAHRPGPGSVEALERVANAGMGPVAMSRRERLRLVSRHALVARFVSSLDSAAASRGMIGWLEKTPIHLHTTEAIERHIPRAKIVHVVREPLPAIASLYAVTQGHPGGWGGARSIEQCTKRWRQDLRRTYMCRERPAHAFLSYELLVASPRRTLAGLLEWLDLEPDDNVIADMMAKRGEQVGALVVDEPWKSGVRSSVVDRNPDRVHHVLSPEHQAEIREAVAEEETLRLSLPFL